jgi:hypothetical protein
MNKKAIGFLSIFSLLLSLSIVPAHSATKAGAKCAKVGIKSVVGNKTFTCIKSGKKLVWNKGKTSVVTPVQVIPDSWPIDKSADKNIYLIADKNFRKFLQSNTTSPKLTINYGPKTDKNRADQYLFSLYQASKFWNSDWKYEGEVVVALGTSEDYSWMSGYWPRFGLVPPFFNTSESSYTALGKNCNHGSAIFSNQPFFWGCMPTEGDLEMIGLKKFSAHEYTHLAQFGIMGTSVRSMPNLFLEGPADFYGMSLASTSENISKNWEMYFAQGFMSEEARIYLKNASDDDIYGLLIDSFTNGTNFRNTRVESSWVYTGAYATVRMIAAKGHIGYVDFMKSIATGGNAGQSFEKIYGVKFEEFAKVIAPEIGALAKTIKSR